MRRTNLWAKALSLSAVQPGQFTKIVTAAFVDFSCFLLEGRVRKVMQLLSQYFSEPLFPTPCVKSCLKCMFSGGL